MLKKMGEAFAAGLCIFLYQQKKSAVVYNFGLSECSSVN